MFVARSIAADHKDLIHDVSFDFHGRRMATCSSDQSVKVSVWQQEHVGQEMGVHQNCSPGMLCCNDGDGVMSACGVLGT